MHLHINFLNWVTENEFNPGALLQLNATEFYNFQHPLLGLTRNIFEKSMRGRDTIIKRQAPIPQIWITEIEVP